MGGEAEVPSSRSAAGGRRIAATYAVVAGLWILFSDRLLGLLVGDPEMLVRWGAVKGLAFVAVTAILLFGVMQRTFGRLERNHARLLISESRARAREIELDRLNHVYFAMARLNHAIAHCHDREELFHQACRILVDEGRFSLAWIGWHDSHSRLVVPVCSWGDRHGGYVAQLRISTDPTDPDGDGPFANAMRSGTPSVCNDLLDDPATAPWREAAEQAAVRAAAAFPVRLADRVQGLLAVYSAEPNVFHEEERVLLEQAASDLSFALDNFEREAQRRRAEVDLAAERRFSDAMMESMPGILYLYDENGRFLRWNRNFETVSGYGPDELASASPLDFFDEAHKPLLAERISEVFRTGEASVEAPFRARDGTTTPYFFTGRRGEINGVPCLVGVGIDISARTRAQENLAKSEQRYRTTLDSILEGCQLLGFDWTYLYLNPAAAVQNRRPNEELLGRRMPEVWPGIEQTPLFQALRRSLEERVPFHEELEFTFPDGCTGWFDVRCQPVPEGIFVLSVDTTDRRAAENALRALNETLELRVAERTAELEAAMIRAESADRLKSAFLATMSHELRTPLNSIIGFTGIIQQGLAGPVNEEQGKQLGMVRASARHLLELINDVLDLSKIEAGQLEVAHEPFDPVASIEHAVSLVMPAADKKGLVVTVESSTPVGEVISDRRRFEQIILNLLNNAIKFTNQGGVTVRIDTIEAFVASGDATRGPALRVCIADTGIGIGAEDLATLFQPFRQLDTGLARQHEGTGLGLAICRRLATLLGGEITATSRPHEGSEFTLVLPLRRPPLPKVEVP